MIRAGGVKIAIAGNKIIVSENDGFPETILFSETQISFPTATILFPPARDQTGFSSPAFSSSSDKTSSPTGGVRSMRPLHQERRIHVISLFTYN